MNVAGQIFVEQYRLSFNSFEILCIRQINTAFAGVVSPSFLSCSVSYDRYAIVKYAIPCRNYAATSIALNVASDLCAKLYDETGLEFYSTTRRDLVQTNAGESIIECTHVLISKQRRQLSVGPGLFLLAGAVCIACFLAGMIVQEIQKDCTKLCIKP